jgi:hypothetical protein
MTEQDPEAFEAGYAKRWLGATAVRNGEGYKLQKAQYEWRIWQTARDHYAPKLTEAEALDAACKAFDEVARRDNGGWVTNEGYAIAAALRAAGVRFKEEA